MAALRHPGVHPFSGWNIPDLLARQAAARGDHPFLIWEPFEGEPRQWSFAGFAHEVDRLAAGLQARGLQAGERLLIHMDNCPELLIAWYACARLGAVAVTTNARSAGAELAYFADHSGAVAALTQPRFAELVNAHCRNLRWLAVTAQDSEGIPGPAGGFAESYEALLGEAEALRAPRPDAMAEVGIQYTSGTTSRPKGVVWTHANALWGGKVNAKHQDLRPEDVHLCYLPTFHTNAQTYSLLAALWAGASCVLQPRFSASRFWPVSLKHRCTWTSMVPFCLKALAVREHPAEHHYRLWGNGICEPPTDAQFGVKTIGWWGMTETMTHGIVGDVHHANRPLSIGRPADEYGIAILDDDGRPVAAGETGHLRVLGIPGLSLFERYLDNPQATAEAFDDQGWFITGDRVTLNEDGSISFADRDKDMLKVGGENVAASEIEQVIVELPSVAEVAVVARAHAMLDEVPVAFVLPDGTAPDGLADEVLDLCRARLADFKVPAEVRVVDSLPRATLEKIAKAQLRRQLADEPA